MTGRDLEPQDSLDTLLATLPTGSAPVADLLTRGHARQRRRRTAVGTGLATAVLAASLVTATLVVQRDGSAGGRTTPVAVDPSPDVTTSPPAPISLNLRASTDASSPPLADDVLTRVRIKATVPGAPGAVAGRETLPWRHQVPGLMPGRYLIIGEVLDDGRPIGSCRRTISVDQSTTLTVVFRGGEPCSIRIATS